jgi:hypothetical protein
MRYARIFCCWSKRLKPNESSRASSAMLDSALLRALYVRTHPGHLFDEAEIGREPRFRRVPMGEQPRPSGLADVTNGSSKTSRACSVAIDFGILFSSSFEFSEFSHSQVKRRSTRAPVRVCAMLTLPYDFRLLSSETAGVTRIAPSRVRFSKSIYW